MGSVLRVLNVFRFLLSLLVFSELWKSTFSSSTLPYWFTYVVLFMCCLEPHGFTSGFTQLQPSLCPQQHGRTIQHGVECRTLTKSGRDCFRTTSTCHGVSCHVRWFNGFKTPTAPRIQSRLLWGQTYKIVKHTNSAYHLKVISKSQDTQHYTWPNSILRHILSESPWTQQPTTACSIFFCDRH